jgi:mono/diheme cytochrome c family protein
LLCCLSFLSGCTDTYPEDLTYGLRTDPLIVVPASQFSTVKPPDRLDPPGEFPRLMQQFVASAKDSGFKQPTVTVEDLNKKEFRGAPQQLNKGLRRLFGTPARPRVEGLELPVVKALQVDDESLVAGSKLYRRHCLHCHGLTGNGQGPTAAWVNPHPRDYRLGVFKFVSTAAKEQKPRREDLLRTLRQGIEGTSMPSFALLTETELNHLVSYVMHLSIRGQVEADMIREVVAETVSGDQVEEKLAEFVADVANAWVEADKKATQPDGGKPGVLPTDTANFAASVTRGQETFQKTCIKCHSEYGRKANLFYDSWGTIVKPANLTLGIYRGGRRPLDLYWRIHVGIPGSNMPGNYGPTALNSEQIWDVVNFLQVLPYRAEREKYGIELDQKLAHVPEHGKE